MDVLFALLLGTVMRVQAQEPSIASIPMSSFSEASLGKIGFEVFSQADRVTLQAAYSANGILSPDVTVGIVPAMLVGKPVAATKSAVETLQQLFASKYWDFQMKCALSPDHRIVWHKGEHTVDVLTCVHCKKIEVSIDGKRLPRQMGLPKTMSLVEVFFDELGPQVEAEAGYEAYLGRQVAQALASARTWERAAAKVTFRRGGPVDPDKVEVIGEWQPLPASYGQEFLDSMTLIVLPHRMSLDLVYSPLELSGDGWVVRCKESPTVQLAFSPSWYRISGVEDGTATRWTSSVQIADRLRQLISGKESEGGED